MAWKWFSRKINDKIKVHKKVKLGIAFGGGGAKGIALIGAVKAFEELGIKFDYVAGTSVGSIVGAALAFGKDSNYMTDVVKSLKMKDIRNSKFIWKPSYAHNIENLLLKVFERDLMFSELNIPFTAVCTDISSGKEACIDYGSVAKAVSGSCAVPGVFTPVQFGDMSLVDGMLKNNVPADVVRNMGANVVIAIDLHENRGTGTTSTKLMSLLSSSLGVLIQTNVEQKLKYADLIISPELDDFKSTKLDKIDELILAGYDAVMRQKENIIKLLKVKPKKRKYE